MRSLRALLVRLASLLGKRRRDAELTEELETHVAMHVDDNVRSGMDPIEARREALMKLGGVTQSRELYRQQARLPVLERLLQDLRYGARMLRKNPGFAVVAIVTLALGIGANTAIFSVVNGVLLRPLPYKDPARLMVVYSSFNGVPAGGATSPPDFRTLREQNHSFESLSAYYGETSNLTGVGRPERIRGRIVSAEYFSTLGVQPMLGRGFLPGEEKWGSHRVVIVSYGFWRSHLNADPDIANKTFDLDGERYNVVGVMPASFFDGNPDIAMWMPMAWKQGDNSDSHNNYFLSMWGRLKAGVTQQQAYADLNAIMLSIAQQFPENKGIGADLKPLHEAWVGDTRPALLVLLTAVGLVLLIACVNLANLLLARAVGRQKEIAIRSAMGAGRGRLLRQFVTESILLALLGGALGLALAYLSLGLLPLAKDVLPLMAQIHLDGRVLLFTVGLCLLTGLLFGLMPAVQSSRSQRLQDALKEGGRTSQEGAGRNRLRAGLVITEVALAMVLLIGSGLAIRSFQRLLGVDPGFSPDHVLSFSISLPGSYDPEPDNLARIGAPARLIALEEQLLNKIEQIPGVEAAGATSSLPLRGENWGKLFTPLDRPLPTSIDTVEHVQYRPVTGHYFRSLGIRLLKGRLLDEHDQANSPYSVVVNEALVRKYWPGQDPIGKEVLLAPPENLLPPNLLPAGLHLQKFSIVGVVADAHYGGLDANAVPVVYASIRQHDFSMHPAFVVRSNGDPNALISSIRSELAQLDKGLPIADVSTMEQIMSESVAQPRLQAVLLGLFGALAIALAVVGIYGVMSYAVSERTSEIGIRMALGATPGNILKMVGTQGLMFTIIGLAVGLGLALSLTRLMSKILFGVSPTDPLTFGVIAVLLAAVALLACWVPARRATKVDPLVALRYE
jgi:predicted permease